jgi:hypothetical protein
MAAAVRDFLAAALALDDEGSGSSVSVPSSLGASKAHSDGATMKPDGGSVDSSAQGAGNAEFEAMMRAMRTERVRATDAFLTPLRVAFAEQEGSWWFTGADVRCFDVCCQPRINTHNE